MADGKEGVNFILVRDGKVLLQQRDGNCPHCPHKWCFPGGGCDEGEEYIDTAVREIKEEYELVVGHNECQELMDRPWANNPGKIFMVRVPSDATTVRNEGESKKWVPIDELSEIEAEDWGFHHGDIVPVVQKVLRENSEWLEFTPESEFRTPDLPKELREFKLS